MLIKLLSNKIIVNMNVTPKQFEQTLRRVIKDETGHLATKGQVDDLTTSVDGLAQKVDSYLNKEWNTHLHDAHPRLENRLSRIERKLIT